MNPETIVSGTLIVAIVASSVRQAVPFLLAALGETFTERSGVLNLGVEGIMLFGGFCGFWIAYVTGSIGLGFLMAALSGSLVGLLMAFMVITLRSQQGVIGIAIFILCGGLVILLNRLVFDATLMLPRIEALQPVKVPLLSMIPVIGPALFNQNVMVYASLLLVPLTWVVLFRTTWGVKITAVGEYPRAADSAGIHVGKIRYLCTIFGGMMAGLAGAYIPLAEVGMFTHNITAGRGFIALAIVVLGRWNPIGCLLGSLLFGAVQALQLRVQTLGIDIPFQFLAMMPYVLTILSLLFVGKRVIGPSALTQPYVREEK